MTEKSSGKVDAVQAKEKKWAALCYVPYVNIVFCVLTAVKLADSKFCRLHYRQGLVLFGIAILNGLLLYISLILNVLVGLGLLYLHGLGIYKSLKHESYKMPIIDDMAMKIPEFYLYRKLTGKKPDKSW